MTLNLTSGIHKDCHVEEMTLAVRDGSKEWIAGIDWVAFARTVTSFPRLSRVTIASRAESEERAAYMQHAHPHLESALRKRGVDLVIKL